MKEIRLYGHLAKEFGRFHHMDVSSPAEAVRALCANFPRFAQAVTKFQGGYKVLTGKSKESITAEELSHPIGEPDIKIVPIIQGASGLTSFILGAALIAFSVAFPEFGAFTMFGAAGSVAAIAGHIGIALLLGGVAQMLSPAPKQVGTPERPDNKPSFSFDGPVNTVAQGNAVPVLYGVLWVGSQVISAGLVAEEYTP